MKKKFELGLTDKIFYAKILSQDAEELFDTQNYSKSLTRCYQAIKYVNEVFGETTDNNIKNELAVLKDELEKLIQNAYSAGSLEKNQ